MSEQKKQRGQPQSPFAALTFSEQQEQWRLWRAQRLDYRDAALPVQSTPAQVTNDARTSQSNQRPAGRQIAPLQQLALENQCGVRPARPSHGNLDRVNARLSHAAGRTGSFRSTTE